MSDHVLTKKKRPIRTFSDVLGRLAGSGRLDSRGQFTVDLKEAARKLSHFQLAEPAAYILKLVQWAVRSGSIVIDITIRKDEIRLWHNGVAPDLDQLAQAESLLTGRGALGHLGVGLNAALGLNPKKIWLQNEGEHLELYPRVRRTSRPVPAGERGTTLVLEGLKQKGWSYRRRESTLVRERCAHAGVDIFLNGRSILNPIWSRPTMDFDLMSKLRSDLGLAYHDVRFLLTEEPNPGTIPCPRLSMAGHTTSWVAVEPEKEEGAWLNQGHLVFWPGFSQIQFGEQPALPAHAVLYKHVRKVNGTVAWLVDGVVVEKVPLEEPFSILADASDLKTDLSQFALVKDARYQRRLDWLLGWMP